MNHLEFPAQPESIKVVGVGGCGINEINRMIGEGLQGVEFIAINTDHHALLQSDATCRVRIGDKIARGLGAGGDPEKGAKAAEESADELYEVLKGADMVFITAGMGGGTGTGAAPIVSQIARDVRALTIGVVTRPFVFEGPRRAQLAEEGIQELKEKTDTLIVISNDRLLQVADKQARLEDSSKEADGVLHQSVQGIWELITVAGLIKLDFADVRPIMAEGGVALMAVGRASGEDRARLAAEEAINSQLLEDSMAIEINPGDTMAYYNRGYDYGQLGEYQKAIDDYSIVGARGILFNVTGGSDLTLREVYKAAAIVKETVHPDAKLMFGAVIDPNLGDEIRMTVIATGLGRLT